VGPYGAHVGIRSRPHRYRPGTAAVEGPNWPTEQGKHTCGTVMLDYSRPLLLHNGVIVLFLIGAFRVVLRLLCWQRLKGTLKLCVYCWIGVQTSAYKSGQVNPSRHISSHSPFVPLNFGFWHLIYALAWHNLDSQNGFTAAHVACNEEIRAVINSHGKICISGRSFSVGQVAATMFLIMLNTIGFTHSCDQTK
jgi:hypothetical protein